MLDFGAETRALALLREFRLYENTDDLPAD